jgi:DNA mismatch repair protein MutL
MGKIQVLPGDVVSRIAAGEVVERPAAVVKELIDNSLDAGSSRIVIDVADGGRSLIRVTDDGEGMTREDARLAFERHATSKLRSEGELSSIRTMGFRGEALPSIASVSKVRLLTACRGNPVGTLVAVKGGAAATVKDAAAAPGTQVEVTDLFFNTPARRKFLKTPTTEFSHLCQVVQHAALAWPGVQFKLTHNAQAVFEYPPVSSARDRVLQMYGARFLEQAVPVSGVRPGLRLDGFTATPASTRASRTPQDLLVNRRPVKNAMVTHAVYDGYGVSLVRGRHPVFVLWLEVEPHRVDVNVHPTKREVRLADQELIHQVVRQAIREAIGGGRPGVIEPRVIGRVSGAASVPVSPAPDVGFHQRPPQPLSFPWTAAPASPSHDSPGAASTPTVRETEPPYLLAPGQDVRPLGQLSHTFLVAQVGAELQVIDQHTAHERVLFERLLRGWHKQGLQSQVLLLPEPIDLPPHGVVLIERHLPELEQLGLKLERFGTASFVIRAVPALLGPLEYASLVADLVEDLSLWDSWSSLDERLRPVLASLACHGAVRAGRQLELPEMKRLVEDWVEEGLPMTCPHGRRVALRLPEAELLKIFGRA